MKRGKLITLEGGEGVGKSTNLQFIRHWLERRQMPLVVTREPGGTAIAERIRSLLLERQEESLCENAELLLVFAARAQHLQQVILPALQQGQWVLCDRFTDATYAYQGGGRYMNLQTIAMLEDMVQGELRPDVTFLFDAPVEVGMHRATRRGELDRFESEQLSFFERIRQSYLQRALSDSGRYKIIDASQSLLDVQTQLGLILDELWRS